MKEPGKGIKVVYGPVHPVIEKSEIIEIPSEKAGEKKIVTHLDLQKMQEEFLEIQANSHYIEQDASNKVMRRVSENGEVLSEKKEKMETKRKSGMDR